jgi:hypothetical protein
MLSSAIHFPANDIISFFLLAVLELELKTFVLDTQALYDLSHASIPYWL